MLNFKYFAGLVTVSTLNAYKNSSTQLVKSSCYGLRDWWNF